MPAHHPDSKYFVQIELLNNDNKYIKKNIPFNNLAELKSAFERVLSLPCEEIYIRQKHLRPLEGMAQTMIDTLIASKTLIKVIAPSALYFSPAQLKLLNKTLKNNLTVADRKKDAYLGLAIIALITGVCMIGMVTMPTLISLLLLFILATVPFTPINDKYKLIAKARYDTSEKIRAVNNPEEQEALLMGLEATSVVGAGAVLGYSLVAYHYPKAFMAAKEFANAEKKDLINEIKKFRA